LIEQPAGRPVEYLLLLRGWCACLQPPTICAKSYMAYFVSTPHYYILRLQNGVLSEASTHASLFLFVYKCGYLRTLTVYEMPRIQGRSKYLTEESSTRGPFTNSPRSLFKGGTQKVICQQLVYTYLCSLATGSHLSVFSFTGDFKNLCISE
jgi:hypothetical protein